MYAFDLAEYRRWREIHNPSYRFWTRVWVDSLHMGTRVHWTLTPLSVLSLGLLWEFMSRQAPQFIGNQRTAIKSMACRRRSSPFYLGRMPDFDATDDDWGNFFITQVSGRDQIRHRLVDWHLNDLQDCKDGAIIYCAMTNLFSSLSVAGYTTDHLFRAVCKNALDPNRNFQTSVEDNIRRRLESFRDPKATEYIAYTKLIPTGPVSNTLRKKWSTQRIEKVDDVSETGTVAVLVGKSLEPFVVTRRAVVSGIAEIHRREAQNLFALLVQQVPGLSIFVIPARSNFKIAESDSSEKYFDVSFKRTELATTEKGDPSGAILFERATRDLFDAPEDAIRNLSVGSELRWRRSTRRETDEILADAYRWALRKRLSRDFWAYLNRSIALGRDASVPKGSVLNTMAVWDRTTDSDLFGSLLGILSRLAEPDDVLTLHRLQEIVHWSEAENHELFRFVHTRREINDLLTVIRGVRNSATHFNSADDELYGVMLYLARVLFEAFTAAWERDSVRANSAKV
jgi:hypothetical protein